MSDDAPMSANSASVKDVRKAKTRANLKRQRQLDDLRAVLKLPQGRRVFRRLLEFAGMHRGGYTGERAHFNEGQRNVGLFLVAELETASPNALEQLRAQHEQDSPS